MGRNPNREIDTTYLSIDSAEERCIVHRDYISHCLRWSHVVRHLYKTYEDAVILDVGCGKELPLAKTVYVNRMAPRAYIGIDASEVEVPKMLAGKKFPITLWSSTDVCALEPDEVSFYDEEAYWRPNTIVCFDVLEHVTPEHARRMLIHLKNVAADGAHFFFSTPCWNGSAAENHINEMKYEAMGALLEDLGYTITGMWGTFASIREYKEVIAKEYGEVGEKMFQKLREYYDSNYLATIFAPLFPSHSRNCLWHCVKRTGLEQLNLFSPLEIIQGSWSSHPDWRDLDGSSKEERGEEVEALSELRAEEVEAFVDVEVEAEVDGNELDVEDGGGDARNSAGAAVSGHREVPPEVPPAADQEKGPLPVDGDAGVSDQVPD